MQNKLGFSSYFVIGVMLFALFFGAGNLIFPAQLGQEAGSNLGPALVGFLLTGVGLPLIGILAMGYSGSSNLEQLASRVHPIYAVVFTAALYLTIGPFFAIPRTATVAYDVGIAPYLELTWVRPGLLIFSIIFFVATLWLSLNPSKIVDRVGKYLAPGIIILLGVLLIVAIIRPLGPIVGPEESYQSGVFVAGFLKGYNTMDALASLVFGIIVIDSIRAMGVVYRRDILLATAKSGLVAVSLLAVIYVGIAYLGATSRVTFGLFDTGGPVLAAAATHYFGGLGAILLAIVIILACITTSIGLITACASYFSNLLPRFSYQQLAVFFSLISLVIANFGLANIINYSIPVLMILYPLAIVLMLLTFLSSFFGHSRLVYATATLVTLAISFFDGLVTFYRLIDQSLPVWISKFVNLYGSILPLYGQGLGWIVPVIIVIIVLGIYARLTNREKARA